MQDQKWQAAISYFQSNDQPKKYLPGHDAHSYTCTITVAVGPYYLHICKTEHKWIVNVD